MGNPALHSTRNVPTVLAGGANGKFRMGRRLKVPADCPASNLWCKPSDAAFNGTANNHLLVSIAQAFGVADRQLRHAAKRRRQERPAGRPVLTVV